MSRLILLGGPMHLEWVEDMGPNIRAPKPTEVRWANEPVLEDLPSVTNYYREKIGDPETRKNRMFYRHEDITHNEALRLLEAYLVKLFVNSGE